MLDFLQRAKRIQALEDITAELHTKYAFARQKSTSVAVVPNYPSNDELYDTVCRARSDAILAVSELGMARGMLLNNMNTHTHIHIHVTTLAHEDTANGTHMTEALQEDGQEELHPDTTIDTPNSVEEGMEFDLFLLQEHNEFSSLVA